MISETLINLDASHQVGVQRYGTKLANEVVPFLTDAKKSLVEQIESGIGTVRSKARLKTLLSSVNKTLDEYYSGYIDNATLGIEDLAQAEIDFNGKSVDSIMVNYDSALPSESQVIKAATINPMQLETGAISFPAAFKSWKSTEINRVKNFITLGFFKGDTTQQIVKQVTDTIDGLTKRNAMTITRTAVNHMATQAKQEFYKENDDLVIGYVYVSTLDSRTSAICRSLDGRSFKFTDSYQPHPPQHPNCRSSETVLLDGRFDFLKKGATRSAKGGPVSSSTNYYEWLKKQPASLQDTVLGKTKGLIFRNSGVTVDEFKGLLTNRMGQEITINQMAAKNTLIMQYLKQVD